MVTETDTRRKVSAKGRAAVAAATAAAVLVPPAPASAGQEFTNSTLQALCIIGIAADEWHNNSPSAGLVDVHDSRTGQIWTGLASCFPDVFPCDYQAYQAANINGNWTFPAYGEYHSGCLYLPGTSQVFSDYNGGYIEGSLIRHKWRSNHTLGEWKTLGTHTLHN